MAVLVVVLLEMVNIDQRQSQDLAGAHAAAAGALQHVIKVAAVGEAGQPVHMGQGAPVLGAAGPSESGCVRAHSPRRGEWVWRHSLLRQGAGRACFLRTAASRFDR